MTASSDHRTDPWTAFGIGILGGVIGGLSLLSFAGVLAVALIALAGGIGLRPRPFGAAGTLIGWAAAWLILLGSAQARCTPPHCAGPDLAPWVGVALALGATGSALVIVGLRQPAWAGRAARSGRAWLGRQPTRITIAVLLGAVSGVYAASLLLPGWITAGLIGPWFAWRHRDPGRRAEIAWFALGAIVSFTLVLPR